MRYAHLLVIPVSAHVFVGDPPPFEWNIEIDKLIMPMNGDPNHYGPEWGQQKFPCKGYHIKAAAEEPRVSWRAGEDVTFHVFDSTNTSGIQMHDPGAAHSGGSCQLSLSYDSGSSWHVIQSWIGNCVRVRKGSEGQLTNSYDTDQAYTFRLPETLPASDNVLMAWTWLNASGNREFYMSCSSIKVLGSSANMQLPSGHPILIANLRADPSVAERQDWAWSRCNVPHGVWVRYPERYRGMNAPIVAAAPANGSPIEFWDLNDPDGFCSSDNQKLVQALALNTPSCEFHLATEAPSTQCAALASIGTSLSSSGAQSVPRSQHGLPSRHDSSSSFRKAGAISSITEFAPAAVSSCKTDVASSL